MDKEKIEKLENSLLFYIEEVTKDRKKATSEEIAALPKVASVLVELINTI